MNIRPILDRILVKPIRPEMSHGGIALLPHVDKGLVKSGVQAEVLAVGPGKPDASGRLCSMWGLKPGMRVLHSPVGSVKAPDGQVLIRLEAVMGLLEAA